MTTIDPLLFPDIELDLIAYRQRQRNKKKLEILAIVGAASFINYERKLKRMVDDNVDAATILSDFYGKEESSYSAVEAQEIVDMDI